MKARPYLQSVFQRFVSPHGGGDGFDQRVAEAIPEALRVQEALRAFLRRMDNPQSFISVGENCSTAWYLKQLGARTSSTPFDWVFSSPAMIADCVTTDFVHFLDPQQQFPIKGGAAAGHTRYHDALFNHKSPLDSEAASALTRSVNRFRAHLSTPGPTAFVMTQIVDNSSRPDWFTGFQEPYRPPQVRSASEVDELVNVLSHRRGATPFILLRHRQGEQTTFAVDTQETVITVDFITQGPSNGVRFVDPEDDFLFMVMLSALRSDCSADADERRIDMTLLEGAPEEAPELL